jgi:hypothetical protein
MKDIKRVLSLLPLILLLLSFSAVESHAQSGKLAKRYSTGGKSSIKGNKKPAKISTTDTKVKEPKAVVRAKKEQEKKQKKLKRDYDKSIEAGKKRQVEIQSPDVQARMKQNKKEIALRDKNRKKSVKLGTRDARKKYKK